MALDWEKLTELAGDQAFVVERVRMADTGIAIEGAFDLPPLARLSADDQVFLAAFVRGHGNIKRMEEWFGVSYPTIKNRLNRIAAQLELVEIRTTALSDSNPLARVASGDMTVADATQAIAARRR